MNDQAPVPTQETVLVERPQEAAPSILQVIQQAATNPDVDIEKMERLMAMHERMVEAQAQKAFNTAMIAAQTEMGPVRTDASNSQTRSKYATYASLDQALRPIYTKHGMAVSFDTADGGEANHVRVIANVMHSDGHNQRYMIDMPTDGKGAKGGDVMTKTHAAGSATSYGMRYLLKLIFNIAFTDDDGNASGSGDKITAEQVKELEGLLKETNADLEKFCRYGGVNALEEMPARDFKRAKDALLAWSNGQ